MRNIKAGDRVYLLHDKNVGLGSFNSLHKVFSNVVNPCNVLEVAGDIIHYEEMNTTAVLLGQGLISSAHIDWFVTEEEYQKAYQEKTNEKSNKES